MAAKKRATARRPAKAKKPAPARPAPSAKAVPPPRYARELLSRAWARSASLRMPRAEVAEAPVEAELAAGADEVPDLPFEDDEPAYSEEVLEEARRDPARFGEFVMRGEDGQAITNAPHHEEFHRILSDPENSRCAILAFAESGKTTAISIARVLWELGHDPNLRVGVLCEATHRAQEIVDVIARYIRESEELHAVFPHLRQARKDADPLRKLKGRPVRWTMTSFTVDRTSRARDPSVRATGFGKPIQGARFDLLIIDDLVTLETSLTDRRRKKLSRWFKSGIAGRLSSKSRVWFLNTAFHPRDLVHEYVKERHYKLFSFPLRSEKGECLWPTRWTPAALAKRVDDLGGEGSVEVARQIDCQAKDETAEQFKDAWIEKCLALGRGVDLMDRWPNDTPLPVGSFILTALDIGIAKTERAAETVLFTVLVYPDGWPEWGYPPDTYQVLWIEAGRWTGPEILERIYDAHERFGSLIYVESNQAQMWLTQFKLTSAAGFTRPPPPVLPFETRANKWSPVFGVTSLGIDMYQGRWVIPSDDNGLVDNAQVARWISEMKEFSPDAHTGDRLMASWIAREGSRRHTMGTGGSVEVL